MSEQRELCSKCGGNGVVKIPGGVSVCPACNGHCWVCGASPTSAVVPEDLRALIAKLKSAQGQIVPVMNDEYLLASWVREIATELESALAARTPQREAQLCSRTVVAWLRAYASQFLVHNLIHGDIVRVADHIEGRAPQREGGQ